MQQNISLKNLLISIIKSIDTYNFLLKDHHRRTAIIAYQLGNAYDLDKKNLDDLVIAASLHDIGALYVKERDQLFQIDVEDPEPHEIQGERILKDFKPLEKISRIIRHHHIKYQQIQEGVVDEKDVPLECHFLHLADRIDVLLLLNEGNPNAREIVIENIHSRFGSVFAPFLKDAFDRVAATSEFWDNIAISSFHDLLFMALDNEAHELDKEDLESLVLVFARIVDYKSAWTATHSVSVSRIAYRLGTLMGLSEDECFEIKIAGYLHDIGKIAVPTELLDKKEHLSDQEMTQIKSHVMYSSLILSPISELETIIKLSANHHEKRNKSGYPLKLSGDSFSLQLDILIFADIFTALNEDRPYRIHLNDDEIKEILNFFIPSQLSTEVYDAIMANYDELKNVLVSSRNEV